jgi:hypothetical protein
MMSRGARSRTGEGPEGLVARRRLGPVRAVSVREPAPLRDPPANRADRGWERRSAACERPDRPDHRLGCLAIGGPSLGLAAQGGPAVGPGALPRGRLAQEARSMGSERPPATDRQAARRSPRPPERHLEVPTGALALELERAMRGAEPDRHAVREVQLAPPALPGSHADHAGWPVSEPPSLVEGLCHEAIIVPPAVMAPRATAPESAPTGRASAANWPSPVRPIGIEPRPPGRALHLPKDPT